MDGIQNVVRTSQNVASAVGKPFKKYCIPEGRIRKLITGTGLALLGAGFQVHAILEAIHRHPLPVPLFYKTFAVANTELIKRMVDQLGTMIKMSGFGALMIIASGFGTSAYPKGSYTIAKIGDSTRLADIYNRYLSSLFPMTIRVAGSTSLGGLFYHPKAPLLNYRNSWRLFSLGVGCAMVLVSAQGASCYWEHFATNRIYYLGNGTEVPWGLIGLAASPLIVGFPVLIAPDPSYFEAIIAGI